MSSVLYICRSNNGMCYNNTRSAVLRTTAEEGKVTLKSNVDEALSNESL
jgi:hypothetical protein